MGNYARCRSYGFRFQLWEKVFLPLVGDGGDDVDESWLRCKFEFLCGAGFECVEVDGVVLVVC